MDNKLLLSVVLPAYQEEENLRAILPRLVTVLHSMGLNFEVIVVDTIEPMDHTQRVCDEHGVLCIARRGGNNYGDAVRTGIEEAKGESVLFMDADGSHTPEFISNLYSHAVEYDVVIASRYIDSGHTENKFILVLMSKIVNWSFSLILNLPCKDVSNSFKIYRGSQLKSLKLVCNNFDIVEEILFKLKRKNPTMRFKEIPFIFKKRMFGETKRNLFIFILTYLYTIIRLRFMS
jgi:dolichol-phosphate mannosyltransferase